ncbi:MAG: Rpn family recombination-promoting nuclease/putative transposase [Bacteroidales bacterium]|nr:Rpn family recombination-promoting nuclease/putative transposase [Bacteroidales bacterium]
MEIVKKNERKVMKPLLDWAFKYLFATEESKPNLIGFLNILLNPEAPIVDVQFMNNESLPAAQNLKGCLFDIICKDANEDRFLIEVQTTQTVNIVDRIIYYTCRLMDRMGKSGSEWDYKDIKRVYSICLMNFTFEQDPKLRKDIQLYDIEEHKAFSDKLNIILLQLPCLKAESIDECNANYEFLLYLLREMQNGMKTTEQLKNEVAQTNLPQATKELFYKVLDTADVASLSEMDRIRYESDLKNYMDTMSCIEFATVKGEEKGRAEGREEGIKEGRKEGKAEEKTSIAKSLKTKGIDLTTIAECTGLTIPEIEKL